MMKYRVNVCGRVCDTDTGFNCGFDLTVENGGSVGAVGSAIQAAIDGMSKEAVPEKVETAKSKD